MTNPIVKRLRDAYTAWNHPPSEYLPDGAGVMLEAAATIERLSAELARAREVLRPFAKLAKGEPDNCILHTGSREFRAARKFIEKEPQG